MKRWILLWSLLLGLPLTGHTDQEPPSLGRLFFTPAQRQALELQRRGQAQGLEGDSISLKGIVQGSSGRRSFWINDQLSHGDTPDRAARLLSRHPGRALLKVQGASAIALGVGESFNRASGERQDILDGGTVAVHGLSR